MTQIHNITKTFRCPKEFSDKIDAVARNANRHSSDIIRDAVYRYITECRENPELAKRW